MSQMSLLPVKFVCSLVKRGKLLKISGANPGSEPDDSKHKPTEEETLIAHTFEGRWNAVGKMYKDNSLFHKAKINNSKDTALHMAVDNGEDKTVEDLVGKIISHEEKGKGKALEEAADDESQKQLQESALTIKNARGDTPLHLAASKGFTNICYYIIGDNKERVGLLKVRNKQGETPLFLAAHNGHKDAFLYLHHCSDYTADNVTRGNKDTILHYAIQREYFDLAVIITHYEKQLIVCVNEKGTPLKALATRPLAFRSGTNLRWWNKLLYNCKFACKKVDDETTKKVAALFGTLEANVSDPIYKTYPEIYDTCYHFIIGTLSKIAALFGFFTKKKQQKDTKKTENDESCYNFFTTLPKIAASLTGCFRKKQKSSGDTENPKTQEKKEDTVDQRLGKLPPNYATISVFLKSAYVSAAWFLGLDIFRVKRIKQKHVWSAQLLDLLMKEAPTEAYGSGGSQPHLDTDEDLLQFRPGLASQKDKSEDKQKNEEDEDEIDMNESALFIAARNGILEMVEKFLHDIPTVIQETSLKNRRNIVLAAVESRQPFVIETPKKHRLWGNLILGVDKKENTALHLAAKQSGRRTWQIPGSAMQMLWYIKWYEYVKDLVPHHFHLRNNQKSKTPLEIFEEQHKELVKEGGEWLKDTSESCSVVAALIAGVAFATSSAVPGGNNETGRPNYEGQPAFDIFAITSLVALCISVTALIMFLAILTSRKTAKDFRRDLPIKLLLGLSSLFVSIASMLVSFCAAHFFVVKDKFKGILFPIYAATCLPVSFYAIAQFPLYVDIVRAIFTKVPLPSDKGGDL